jgi:uncharacterized SAM-binding protein YcdF (DUF218 family)
MIKFILSLISAYILIALVLSFYLNLDDLQGCGKTPDGTKNCKVVDAIIAISGGDTEARTNEAIRLYQNGWSEVIVFSGAAQDKTGPSNAAVMKSIAISAGVPESSIYIDEYSATTKQNAIDVRDIINAHDIKSAILVTSGYHQRRASLEFSRHTSGVAIVNHSATADSDWSRMWFISPRGWWLATSEIAKILVFYAEGIWR